MGLLAEPYPAQLAEFGASTRARVPCQANCSYLETIPSCWWNTNLIEIASDTTSMCMRRAIERLIAAG
jgi:hypothetical protein